MKESTPKESQDRIVSAAIYPPIGVCRIGGSKEFFLAPEVPNPLPEKPNFYRDSKGLLKRQAARFRIFGLDADGKPVRELTAKEAKITWNVHLANQKAAWYEFQIALDVPEAADSEPSYLRNPQIQDRKSLIIDAGQHSIAGTKAKGKPMSGKFMGKEVYLGELQTDDAGRLVVIGGQGKSASYDGSVAITFANNQGWHDDTSDGSVTASVEYQGNKLQVKPAWVITAPPNYAPLQKSVRTMWDLMRDTAIQAKMLAAPAQPSFMNDILPIFERLTNLQWVNAGFAAGFGYGGVFDFFTPEWLPKLSNPSPAYKEQRRVIANHFRVFDRDSWSPTPFPWLYGDSMSIPAAKTPRQYCTLSNTQLKFLQQWADGNFIADYDPKYVPPRNIDQVPPEQQPDVLTRAAMEFCLADAFHPGCEMTWPMRLSGMYSEAFRIQHAPAGWVEPGYGAVMNISIINMPNSPVNGGQLPGGVTRWMAVPWQTDTASCRSGYEATYDPFVPTFWPARVPNHVMSQESYKIVMDKTKPLGERLEAFAKRANWNTPLGLKKSYTEQINNMIHNFDKMSVVVAQKGLTNDPNFPPVMEVEDIVTVPPAVAERGMGAVEDEGEITDFSTIEKVRRRFRI